MIVRFKRERDGCCRVCNPMAMADLECPTVSCELENGARLDIELCDRCARAFANAFAGRRSSVTLDPEVVSCARDIANAVIGADLAGLHSAFRRVLS